MAETGSIFLTGATGQIGGCVLGLLATAGRKVICLARPDSTHSAEQRVRDTLVLCGFDGSLPFECVEGDITEDRLGLSESAYHSLCGRIGRVVHSAARIMFRASPDGEPQRTNLHGTVRVVRLAEDAGRVPFFYVSTAYVCGTNKGPVLEQFDATPHEFKNAYEESKWRAESVVWEALGRGLPASILRPSIVVGDSRDGRALHFQGFYLASRALSRLASQMRRRVPGETGLIPLGLTVPGRPDDPINLVPADYIADAITFLVQRDDLAGRVLHLTHPIPQTLGGIYNMFASYYRIDASGLFSNPDLPFDARHSDNAFNRLFWKVSNPIHDYFANTPEFDRRVADSLLHPAGIVPAPLDQLTVNRLLDFAERAEYGKRPHPVTAPSNGVACR